MYDTFIIGLVVGVIILGFFLNNCGLRWTVSNKYSAHKYPRVVTGTSLSGAILPRTKEFRRMLFVSIEAPANDNVPKRRFLRGVKNGD